MKNQDIWLIVSDFDETFMPAMESREPDAGIERLQNHLAGLKRSHKLLFGWATGNSRSAVMEKMRAYPDFPWDFALTSLGTELYWREAEGVVEDAGWPSQAGEAFESRMERLVALFYQHGLALPAQADAFQQRRIRGYYLPADGKEGAAIEQIHRLCAHVGLAASITHASPAAGDPEGVYDVAILPPGCGKKQGVDFIAARHGVDPGRVIVFGDSCNDIEMLTGYENGYLVGNALAEARRVFDRVVDGIYCHGIIDGLQRHI
ncbi:NTD biosynthesis hydrolase NtdB [Chromobacterium violaceum]|uniref:HAD-IIB family hydrolase n=1 Tax=Chromobacterium violaceum TaxID=536 RepID=UPI0009DACD79|nr:HAD-IIB family hydrolase [Chromobacterium violaceum]OQS10231.1 NTD biosynthesis hydrolase NtdB [Chromobacterium violaceum]OQS26645.1 NTD biosynthesis hydrolase NtdB [Chromobacterium violaceum]